VTEGGGLAKNIMEKGGTGPNDLKKGGKERPRPLSSATTERARRFIPEKRSEKVRGPKSIARPCHARPAQTARVNAEV